MLCREVPLDMSTSYNSMFVVSPTIALPLNSSTVLEIIVRITSLERFISPPVLEVQCKNYECVILRNESVTTKIAAPLSACKLEKIVLIIVILLTIA